MAADIPFQQPPCREGVSCRSLRPERDGREQLSREPARGHYLLVHEELCPGRVAVQADIDGRGARESEGRIFPEFAEHRGLPAVVVRDHRVARGPRCLVAVVAIVGHLLYLVLLSAQLADDTFTAAGLEHRPSHDAEGIHKVAAEGGVLQQIEEDGHNLHLAADAWDGLVELVVQRVPCPCLLAGKAGEGRAQGECMVDIVEDEAEASVLMQRSPALEIVLRPVVVAHVHLHRHVVTYLVHIDETLYLGIALVEDCRLGQLVEALPCRAVATLLHVSRVAVHLKEIYLVIVISIVGIDEVLVVRLPQVDGSAIEPVEEMHHRLVALCIDVQSAAYDNLLHRRVAQAAVVVVACTAEDYLLVAQVRLVVEELIVEPVLSLVYLLGIHLPSVGGVGTAVSPVALHARLLIDHLTALGIKVLDVHRPVPVHVPVARRGLSQSGTSVHASGEDAQLGAVQMSLIRGHGHGCQRYVEVLDDVCLCDHWAGQHAVLVEAQAHGARLAEDEASGPCGGPVGERRRAAVGGIAQGEALGDGDRHAGTSPVHTARKAHLGCRCPFGAEGLCAV